MLVCRRYLSDEPMRLILDAVTELDVSLPNDDDHEPGHLDPARAAQAVALLRDPGPAFAAAVRELTPEVRTVVLGNGEGLTLPEGSRR